MSKIKKAFPQKLKFDCVLKSNNAKESWNGEIKRFIDYGSHLEFFIESRSSILILFGKTSRGNFACMPDFNVGCHLVDLKDNFWNSERLCSVLGKVDGITTAAAFHQLYVNNYAG